MAAASASASSANALQDIFGETLVRTMGDEASDDVTVKTSEAFASTKQIGIYFSAHWCPPCRGFTPKLTKEYTDNLKKIGFEIVFASSDKDRKACKEYFEEMGSWLALPYDNRGLYQKLSKKFKVNGIPTLVLLDANGNFVSASGRSFIGSGKSFPFVPPTVSSSLGDTLLKKVDGKVVEVKTEDALRGKNVALYFSAHWCPPCRAFTPTLAKLYETMKKQAKAGNRKDDFEFVFVSSDRDQDGFDEYYGEMPWCALPHKNRSGKSDLSQIFGVRGIPSLITIDTDFKVINKSARGVAESDSEGAKFPWHPEPVNEVNAVTDGLNDEVCVIVLLDGASSDEYAARKKDLDNVAKKILRCGQEQES